MIAPAQEWRTCPSCPPDDNQWTADEFFPGMARCKACYSAQKRLAEELKSLGTDEKKRERKRRGICQECPNPVAGTVAKALYCAACMKRRRGLKERKHRRSGDVRERRNARKRELHQERMATDPTYAAAYRRRRQEEKLLSYPGRARYEETQRRHNADPARQERKRELARAKYYELHPERPRPVCATCGEPIPYDGRGMPPKYHQVAACNPYLKYPSQRKRLVTQGASA